MAADAARLAALAEARSASAESLHKDAPPTDAEATAQDTVDDIQTGKGTWYASNPPQMHIFVHEARHAAFSRLFAMEEERNRVLVAINDLLLAFPFIPEYGGPAYSPGDWINEVVNNVGFMTRRANGMSFSPRGCANHTANTIY